MITKHAVGNARLQDVRGSFIPSTSNFKYYSTYRSHKVFTTPFTSENLHNHSNNLQLFTTYQNHTTLVYPFSNSHQQLHLPTTLNHTYAIFLTPMLHPILILQFLQSHMTFMHHLNLVFKTIPTYKLKVFNNLILFHLLFPLSQYQKICHNHLNGKNKCRFLVHLLRAPILLNFLIASIIRTILKKFLLTLDLEYHFNQNFNIYIFK